MFVMSTGGLLHTEVCIGLDIAHLPSLMYGFIMQQAEFKFDGVAAQSCDVIKSTMIRSGYMIVYSQP